MLRQKKSVSRLVPLFTLVFILPAAPVRARDDQAAARKTMLQEAVDRGAAFWRQIASAEPRPTSGCRQLLSYALVLCEARVHAERLDRLFTLVRQMQDQDAKSKTWGNLRWYWRDAGVTDPNAVEFCMQDALLIHIRHGDWLPPDAKQKLDGLLLLGVEGCLRHRVPTDYTNIAILNSGNLIVLGEQLHRPDAEAEGRRRLDALWAWTATFGVHEFCSPTYYGTDLNGLLMIHTYAKDERARLEAAALLRLFWTDIAANWFPAAERLSGCQSRSYDYLRGVGGLDWHLWIHGWLRSKSAGSAERREPWAEEWSPPAALAESARRQLPRSVRQRWGLLPTQSRSQAIYPDVALSCLGASYGNQDSTLVVDLPGGRDQPRCYFIPDGREDPYGKNKYETGSARHLKALHLQPFWAGAQRLGDALGLVIYRGRDLSAAEVTHLQSHFVLRRTAEIWLDGKRLNMPAAVAPAIVEVPVPAGSSLVLRYESAAVAIRTASISGSKGKTATARLVDDGNSWKCLRLTVDHGRSSDFAGLSPDELAAGAAFWVRVGSGLAAEADFDAWRKDFDSQAPLRVVEASGQVHVEVTGKTGLLSIAAHAPWDQAGRVRLVPAPYQGPLEVNGKELGRPMLTAGELLKTCPAGSQPLTARNVPAGKAFFWEAESGLVLPGTTVLRDADASGQSCVGQESSPIGQPSGSVLWSLAIEKPGRYWLWARVRSDARRGAFAVQVIGADGAILPAANWISRAPHDWQWQRLEFEGAKPSAALNLTKGACLFQFQTRQSGTRIDRLMLTDDPNQQP